jgi:hypothetical protein
MPSAAIGPAVARDVHPATVTVRIATAQPTQSKPRKTGENDERKRTSDFDREGTLLVNTDGIETKGVLQGVIAPRSRGRNTETSARNGERGVGVAEVAEMAKRLDTGFV